METVLQHYRRLQIVNIQFNVCFHSIVMPFIFFTVGSINILGTYATIRLYDEVSMPGYLGFPLVSLATAFIILDTFPASYQIYKESENLIRKTRQLNVPNGYTAKFLDSCRPLSIKVSKYFIVKQVTLMTYLGFIIDNAIMLLLTF